VRADTGFLEATAALNAQSKAASTGYKNANDKIKVLKQRKLAVQITG
jgi:hypothetical protein